MAKSSSEILYTATRLYDEVDIPKFATKVALRKYITLLPVIENEEWEYHEYMNGHHNLSLHFDNREKISTFLSFL